MTDSTSEIEIKAFEGSTAVSRGTNFLTVKNGTATFDQLQLVAEPGTTGVTFQLKSSAIESRVLRKAV